MMKTPLILATAVALTAAMTPAAASGTQRVLPGASDWCSNSSYGDDRERHSEVREFVVPASGATIAVDATPNGGIKVEGQARQDVQVQACVTAAAATVEQARAIAQRVEVVATAD